MNCKYKNIISVVLILVFLVLPIQAFAYEGEVHRFNDVPKGHWADKVIHDMRSLGITEGMGNNKFGMGLDIKRSEFVTYLVKLMKWELVKPETGNFIDNMDATKWYYSYIETALKNNVMPNNKDRFYPDESITREDMAIMIVNTLRYDTLAKQLTYLDNYFEDVSNNVGYITIAKDLGIIKGVGDNKFNPTHTAKREEATAMMMRMYERLNTTVNELHAFYAIRSYNQMDMITDLDSVSFGWSRMGYDQLKGEVILNTTANNNNDYYIPNGFSEPMDFARQNNVSTQLMVFADNNTWIYSGDDTKVPLIEHILMNPKLAKQAITSIVQQVNTTTKDGKVVSFDGVTIDFESMRGEVLKQSFTSFLVQLRQELNKSGKKLYVTVHPKRKLGQEYYDGYDYKAIGEIADKVILMAHDYNAKKLTDNDMQKGYTVTPLSPIDEVYYALKAITDEDFGVQDLNKIWLQLSFDAVQWKLKDGKVIKQYPYTPSYNSILERLITEVEMDYSNRSQNPHASFFDSSDETHNVLWYEDSRSMQAKIKLARMFGINGISVWRLGNIPNYREIEPKELYLDVWDQILGNK